MTNLLKQSCVLCCGIRRLIMLIFRFTLDRMTSVVQISIRVTSEKYRPVANRSSLLFFLMNDLVKIHSYYIYSLAAFTKVCPRHVMMFPAASRPYRLAVMGTVCSGWTGDHSFSLCYAYRVLSIPCRRPLIPKSLHLAFRDYSTCKGIRA